MMDTSWTIHHQCSTATTPSISLSLSQFSPVKLNWSFILQIQVDLLCFFNIESGTLCCDHVINVSISVPILL